MAANSTMRDRRAAKKSVKKRKRQGFVDVDAVLLRCVTIERRLEGIEAVQDIQAQRMSTLQEQLDHLESKRRP